MNLTELVIGGIIGYGTLTTAGGGLSRAKIQQEIAQKSADWSSIVRMHHPFPGLDIDLEAFYEALWEQLKQWLQKEIVLFHLREEFEKQLRSPRTSVCEDSSMLKNVAEAPGGKHRITDDFE
ncbi:hypothetical protein M407DRAFT_9114 [Tulasnella calospora MUT 4182]|uniref:Uncharacterized protein n=1 Tax=Tulasnella calospora MUT 4182 TaxID=1051891 RepID=A0A0C3KRQ2_9AGAM|nr:hypothetical protein M407DRAFT_9114 [Tulasnella calospora MUT 4182]